MSYTDKQIEFIINLVESSELTYDEIALKFNEKFQELKTPNSIKKTYYRYANPTPEQVKVLLIDIETAPMMAHVWGLWDNNVALNQLKSDWYILSFSAKWLHETPEDIMYFDQRNAKNIEDDSVLLGKLWKLLDEADVIIGQNHKHFDLKKINARLIQNGYPPPSSYRTIDTLEIAKSVFGFTSNKLEYMTDKLCKKYKKLKHAKFSGFELWKECLAGNTEAWTEMEKYNSYDVLSLEELYKILIPWKPSINFNVYTESDEFRCNACGCTEHTKNGFKYSNLGKYQKYKCSDCGAESVSRENLLSKEKRKSLRK